MRNNRMEDRILQIHLSLPLKEIFELPFVILPIFNPRYYYDNVKVKRIKEKDCLFIIVS